MAKYTEVCECCGAKKNLYQHKLNKAMVSALAQLYKKNSPVNLQKDLTLTKNQYNNFQKMQYMGLVEGLGSSALWRITDKGVKFITGRISICDSGFSFGKETLQYNHKLVKEAGCKYSFVYVEKIVKEDYQKLVDYIN